MPWCPKCREEYREGFTTCIDCGAELTDELPPPEETAGTDDNAWERAGEYGRRPASRQEAGGFARAERRERRVAPAGDSLWCPKCGAEYRQGFTLCKDCGVELTDVPPDICDDDGDGEEEGQAEAFCDAFLTTAADWAAAARIETLLNEDGIPVEMTATGSGVDIYVPEELLENAWDVLGSDYAGDEARICGEDGGGADEPALPAAGGSGRLWCPNCRVEYWQEGVTVCSDCGAKLVDPATGKGEGN